MNEKAIAPSLLPSGFATPPGLASLLSSDTVSLFWIDCGSCGCSPPELNSWRTSTFVRINNDGSPLDRVNSWPSGVWRLLSPRHQQVRVYHCHCLSHLYLSDYIQRVADSNRRRLRSSSSSPLVIRRTRLSTVGDRAFSVAGNHLWNILPPDITSALTLTVFLNRPKILRTFPS